MHIYEVLKTFRETLEKAGYEYSFICLDGWLAEENYNDRINLSRRIQSDIKNAGLITNDERSVWQPCQEIVWLGLIWNSLKGTISVTERRVANILYNIEYIQAQKLYISPRELASFTGKLVSTSSVTRNIGQIMTRYCSMTVAAASDWDVKFPLDDYCVSAIQFCKNNFVSWGCGVCLCVSADTHHAMLGIRKLKSRVYVCKPLTKCQQ
jgi:hypothetical protein